MKKINLLIIFILLLLMVGCIKQKNCKDCMTGKWVYLEKPKEIVTSCKNGVVAYFLPDRDIIEGSNPYYLPIVSDVPKKFQKHDTTKVTVCLKSTCKDIRYGFTTYKVTCIEFND